MINEQGADLHVHTNYSDGQLRPEEVIKRAAQAGLRAISVTDHDNVAAVEVAQQQGEKYGVEVMAGVELSATFGRLDVHILGYGFDIRDPNILGYLQLFREERTKRAQKILEKLGRLGIRLSFESVRQRAGKGSIGRPHIAHVMAEEAYVFSYQEAFDKYLAEGRPAYVPKYKITAQEAIEIIHSAGGLTCVAHPGLGVTPEVMAELIRVGIDGIETIHPKHSPTQTCYYEEVATKHGLLQTGGSDYHGDSRSDISLGTYTIPYQFVEELKRRLHKRSQERSLE